MNACIDYVAEVPFSPGAVLRIPTDEDLRLAESPDFDPKQRAPCAPNAISRQRSS